MKKCATVDRDEVRRLLADYIASEGCSCCQNTEEHEKATKALGKLLKVKRYPDHSGYDFFRYQTKE